MQYNTQHINITQHNKIDHYSTVHHLNMSPGQMDLVSFTCCLGAVATVKRWAKAVRLLGPRAATSGWEMNFVMCSEQIFFPGKACMIYFDIFTEDFCEEFKATSTLSFFEISYR